MNGPQMDPATVIALCKENIQPLRHGRNAVQLGTALRAQEDADAQQLLQQEKQMYEDAIKSYDGDDPLENWYEYILWVEQSYPKSGHESPLARLLQDCLATFEKDVKYHQDRRYIRLWINYISMQKNPLELYQLLYRNGIGTMVSDMYRAWAFELEQSEDYKRADEVYMIGVSTAAQPQEELDYAHKNFQLAVARKMLGRTENKCEVTLAEQRQAFSSLRAIRAGKKVTSIRTGHRVRDYLPGTMPQIGPPGQSSRSSAKIQIYQDEGQDGQMKGSSILDHIPTEEVIHKENTIKPGPWNSGSRKHPLMSVPVKTSFKVHEDDVDDQNSMERLRLFPNHTSFFDGSKYHDHLIVPVYVPDPPNPHIIMKVHYPKDLVYTNNVDRSMEEIKAQFYLERRAKNLEKIGKMQDIQLHMEEAERVNKLCEIAHQRHEVNVNELAMQRQEAEQRELERQRQLEQQRREAEMREIERQRQLEQQRREAEQLEFERQRHEAEQREVEKQRQEVELLELERRKRQAEQLEHEIQRRKAEQLELDRQRYEAERQELGRLEAERIEAERIEAERMEAQRMEAELNRQQKLPMSNYMHRLHTSADVREIEEHLLGQSLTVNTKEAMSAVQGLWRSPEEKQADSLIDNTMMNRLTDSRPKILFDIHMDSSMTQQAMSTSKRRHEFNVHSFNDQENHFHVSYTDAEHQPGFASHGFPTTYHYQVQQHQQVQAQHHQQAQSQHHQLQPHHQQVQAHHQQIQSHQQLQQHIHPQHHQHQSLPQSQHQQHHAYENIVPSTVGYQQYASPLQVPSDQHQSVEAQKQLHFTPYTEPIVESNKSYKMPSELPYIKSPGMNRRDLKYLEGAEDKENEVVLDYNEPVEENQAKATEENLFIDESLGIAPLSGINETCFTEAFNTQLSASTPMTSHFKPSYRMKDVQQFPEPPAPTQEIPGIRTNEADDKLSVIMESTGEYVSSSSGSNVPTRLGFTITREEMVPIKEQSSSNQDMESTVSLLAANQTYEQKMRAQIQAVHAQSPRTVQRNVDQITSEIKTNCDLHKSIGFKLNDSVEDKIDDSMECEEHEPMEEVDEELFEFPTGDINPFDSKLITKFLKRMKFPQARHAEGYVRLNSNLNKFVPFSTITLGTDVYELETCLGKGTYGKVFKAFNSQTHQTVALKTQKPACVWEYYIAREIKTRLTNPHMLRGFMDITMAYIADNGSVLVSEFSKYGTLLAVTNDVKMSSGKSLNEILCIYFTIEMLQIVEYLQKCQIIHGDIKPDNFLLMHIPTEDVRPTIQLIDFGCSIDMSLFPKDTKFTQIVKTPDFTCVEMQTGRPWTYQTDLYCLAACSHCLLFGNYMRVANTGGRWFMTSKLPRYAKKQAWEPFFTELLNIESCEKLPDLAKLRNGFEEVLVHSELQMASRNLSNILNKR
ncbi:uncharacterized protein LOC105694202 isoform X2 [Orussus abietinus]|nr:uncharacterized protein LOC105694202 isoform X2 [Orussus abietinus]XP_012270080.1 uncharacterized protein LOC105694202 isoform X2 [Orussus abietinus]XP_012270081.1 uncharacterized protein LOC105694202 isoform X2 [Orussus abietinus]